MTLFGMTCLTALFSLAPAPHDGHEHMHAAAESTTVERAVLLGEGDFTYESVPDWCRLPDERPLGNTHGAIVIDRKGNIYFNTDTKRSIMVYAPDGTFLRAFGEAYPGIHSMVLRVEDDQEYIYAAHLHGKQVIKFHLDGTVAWTIGVPMESGKYDDNPNAYNPTAVAVEPNGGIYVADGYGRNWIHQFTKDREYVRCFGGPGEAPGQFRTCHGLVLDDRGDTPVLIVCDRENRRLQRFDLDGNPIDVPIAGLRRPCAISMWNNHLAVAELEGRVTILDSDFKVVTHLGDNPDRGQWANNGVKREAWIHGIFTAPHGCCFDRDGNLYVMDWNASGRISKLKRLTTEATSKPGSD